MNKIGIPKKEHTGLIVIDFQEKLVPIVQNVSEVLKNANLLLMSSEILSLTTIITEQYPKGLGRTCNDLYFSSYFPIVEKNTFSCMQNKNLLEILKKNKIKDLIVCGIEAHICVLNSCIEAIEMGFTVHVVADAISSRTNENKVLAIKRMLQSGVYITSTEMILFMLLNEAGTDEFKAISKLIK